MKYAVVKIGGTQYKVEEGKEILVDKVVGDVKPQVLLVVNEDVVKIGKPEVSGAMVKVKVINQEEKGEKIKIFKYKAKSRYRKRMGFRPRYTRLLVEKIS